MTIKNAAGLPPSLSHFVFGQYVFWGDSDTTVVPPAVVRDDLGGRGGQNNDMAIVAFNHTRQFSVPVTEEFMEHCAEGALSIEVYGHKSVGFGKTAKLQEREQLAKSLADR